jgi:dipeptidyl aminopeptidase/acylaminoacyl peptidase
MSARTYAPTLALVLIAALAAPIAAQELRPFTPETALDVRSVRIADVTDDGALVAATVQTRRDRTDVDHQRFGDPTYVSPVSTRLMVIETESGAQTWIHEQPVVASGFTWSPDGTRLAYFLNDAGEHRLRIHDVTTGRARTVELRTEKAIASSSPLVWSPDGASLLVGLRPVGWAEEARQAFHALTAAPVIVQDSRDDFLAWDRVQNLADRQITALVTLADGSVRELLTEGTPRDPGFSVDGSRLTYATVTETKTSYTRRDGSTYQVFSLDLASGDVTSLMGPSDERIDVDWSDPRDAFAYAEEGAVFVRRVADSAAVDVTADYRRLEGDTAEVGYSVERWSPDGSELLLTSSRGWHVVDPAGRDLQTVLTLEEDEDTRPERDVQAWTDDGGWLYFARSARDRWERGIQRLDLGSGRIETVVLDERLYGSWNVSDDASTIVYSMSDGDRPDDLWVMGARFSSPMRLTDLNPQLADVALTRSELVEYLDVDGNRLYGILYYPVGYEPGRKYPLVAEIYEEFFDNGFNENMNLITARGWFGFRPSVEFEIGYPGEAWLKAVPTAINEVVERGVVDEKKLGVYGQSYGGYATNLLITQTDRFAAAANISGKVNIISFLGDSPKITTRNYAAAEVGQDRIGATLWEQPHKYVEHSAVMYADRIETPLLMLSGEGDWNVPATNQREMYYALRRLGKEVVWVHYTAGGHGAGRASSAADFVDHWQRMFDWFAEHFEEDAASATVSEQGGR